MTATRTARLQKLPPLVRPRRAAHAELDALAARRAAAVAPYRAKIARCEAAVLERLRQSGVDEATIQRAGEGCIRRDAAVKRAWDAFYEVWFSFSDRIKPLLAPFEAAGNKISATKLLQRKTRRYDGCGLETRVG